MKALAASSIGQYEKSVSALGDYYRTVELGFGAYFRENVPSIREANSNTQIKASAIGAVGFGSDQGLVGQFNDIIADFAIKTMAALPGRAHAIQNSRKLKSIPIPSACRRKKIYFKQ